MTDDKDKPAGRPKGTRTKRERQQHEAMLADPKFVERFWQKVTKDPDCWLWSGALHQSGYGRVRMGRNLAQASRIAWELENGELPSDIMLQPTCRQRACIRPDHMKLVPFNELSKRRVGKPAVDAHNDLRHSLFHEKHLREREATGEFRAADDDMAPEADRAMLLLSSLARGVAALAGSVKALRDELTSQIAEVSARINVLEHAPPPAPPSAPEPASPESEPEPATFPDALAKLYLSVVGAYVVSEDHHALVEAFDLALEHSGGNSSVALTELRSWMMVYAGYGDGERGDVHAFLAYARELMSRAAGGTPRPTSETSTPRLREHDASTVAHGASSDGAFHPVRESR